MVIILTIIAIIAYSAASLLQFKAISQGANHNRKRVLNLGFVAVTTHGLALATPVLVTHNFSLGAFNMGSLIAWVISAMILSSSLRKNLENLFLGIFPMAAIIMLINALIPSTIVSEHKWTAGIMSHILLSITAYSLLTIAAFQAVLLMIQVRQLKHKHTAGILRILPPLQTMDRLLFEIIGAGTFLLTLAILSGAIFVDNLFAQHLVHKTAFTLMAWAVFSFLLFANWRFGWRGNVAAKWTLAGIALLILAYFGSKLVLEFILEKS